MKILKESRSSTAWCIDTRGNIYDVYVHPYGAYDMDAIEDAAWMFLVNFGSKSDNELFIDYIANQLIFDFDLETMQEVDNSIDDIKLSLTEIESIQKYSQLKALVSAVISSIKEKVDNSDFVSDNELSSQSNKIKKMLNNNFLRVRYGSHFQTFLESEGSLYFRVSSSGVDWYNIILDFTLKFSENHNIKDITIEKDKASTGTNKIYLDHMPFEDFLFKKPFIVEALNRIG